jgi:ABC-type transporter Mla maintaining outer membrane lipid asymmetry ATPase subunit MlaF
MIAPDTLNEILGDGGQTVLGETVLRFQGLTLSREGVNGLEDLDLQIRGGETVALVADSEWVVRRMARSAIGLELPQGGRVDLLGQEVLRLTEQARLRLRRSVGYLFHNSGLIHNLTVWYNVALPALYHSRFQDTEGVRGRVDRILKRCRLTPVRDRRPATLDEYTRKRVALGRTWVLSPPLIVIEDPLVDIDSGSGSRLMEFALGPTPSGWEGEDPRPAGAAVLITSQGLHESLFRFAHRLVIIREGKVVFADNPGLFDRRGKREAGDLIRDGGVQLP